MSQCTGGRAGGGWGVGDAARCQGAAGQRVRQKAEPREEAGDRVEAGRVCVMPVVVAACRAGRTLDSAKVARALNEMITGNANSIVGQNRASGTAARHNQMWRACSGSSCQRWIRAHLPTASPGRRTLVTALLQAKATIALLPNLDVLNRAVARTLESADGNAEADVRTPVVESSYRAARPHVAQLLRGASAAIPENEAKNKLLLLNTHNHKDGSR
jgi:hypothetical protein